MKYVIVENGIITNVAEWDGVSDWSPPKGATAYRSDEGGIGWGWVNGKPVDLRPPPPPAPPPVAVASPAQFREELMDMNKLDAVQALIAQQDAKTQSRFEYATEFRSNSPLLLALAAHPTIGMSEQDVFDALTRAAARDIGA